MSSLIGSSGVDSLIIGIDASRSRSGGAKAHLKGILNGVDPCEFGVSRVHLWAFDSLADSIPDYPWLTKHTPSVLNASIAKQLFWQRFKLPRLATELGCQLMFNTDAGSVCPFRPCATMSQDMLSFEPGEMRRYFCSKAWFRLLVLRYVQAASLKRSDVALFLTNHAASVIQNEVGHVKRQVIVPHGINDEFRQQSSVTSWPTDNERPIRLLYVSNAAFYKHQWHVVRAVGAIRGSIGRDVSLLLVGGGAGEPQKLLDAAVKEVDPDGEFVEQRPYVLHAEIPQYLAEADAFIFASSCENMPITLLEAMASGLPIACSNRGPMPEVLGNGGEFFDPESSDSIQSALIRLISQPESRVRMALRAQHLSNKYSWERCARETWQCLTGTVRQYDTVPCYHSTDQSAR